MARTRAGESGTDVGDTFATLMVRLRLRLGLSQRRFGELVGVRSHSIEGWESGTDLPSAKSLRALIGALLKADGFSPGREVAEAGAMWAAARRHARRLRMPFDRVWFANLLAQDVSVEMEAAPLTMTRQYWGEAPHVDRFVGRTQELETLKGRILRDRCRVVAVLGVGGVGKTTFAAKLARDVAAAFERVYWRSLRNAPPPSEWLRGAIGFLAQQKRRPLDAEAVRQTVLVELLRENRCLLVLDNVETVLEPGQPNGRFRKGFEEYGSLLRHLGEVQHQSCLVLTSREEPAELSFLKSDRSSATALELDGLEIDACRALLDDKNLSGTPKDWALLVRLFGGNALALRIVGETICQLFDGYTSAFLGRALANRDVRFSGIRPVLDEQLARMSELEWHVVRWLALEREPVTFAELVADVSPSVRPSVVLEILDGLRRRSLLERATDEPTFTLQPVVLDYVTEQLVRTFGEEVLTGKPFLLLTHALVKATARDYVRHSQERLIATPVLEHLTATFGDDARVAARLNEVLDSLRTRPRAEHGYGPGNMVNLLRLLRTNPSCGEPVGV